MKIENMLACVQSGCDVTPLVSRKKVLKHGIGCFLGFLVMSPLGFTYNALTAAVEVLILFLTAAYCVCCLIIASKPMTRKGDIAHAAFSCVAYSGAFLGLSMIAFERVQAPWYGLSYVIPVILVILSFWQIHRKTKANAFLRKKKKGEVIIPLLLPLIPCAGHSHLLVRSFVSSLELDTDTVLYLCAIGAYFVGCVMLIGIDALVKLYYIQRLKTMGIKWDS
jgi:hypothetical protein